VSSWFLVWCWWLLKCLHIMHYAFEVRLLVVNLLSTKFLVITDDLLNHNFQEYIYYYITLNWSLPYLLSLWFYYDQLYFYCVVWYVWLLTLIMTFIISFYSLVSTSTLLSSSYLHQQILFYSIMMISWFIVLVIYVPVWGRLLSLIILFYLINYKFDFGMFLLNSFKNF
jgi:hypothetical protein